MNICLIGYGIPCLILANILTNKNIKISIFDEYKSKNEFNIRTLGITKDNINFLKQEKINIKKYAWPINNIKIFNESYNEKEILNFGSVKENLFFVTKYRQFIDLLEKNIKKKKLNLLSKIKIFFIIL